MIALGSHGELDTQCEIATRRRFISSNRQEDLQTLLTDVRKITFGLLRSLDPIGFDRDFRLV